MRTNTKTGLKYCPSCKKNLSPKLFHNNKLRPDGKNDYCKECQSKKAKAHRNTKTYKNYMERTREHKRDLDLQKSYDGFTIKQWEEMFEEQHGCCAICGIHQSQLDRKLDTHHMEINGEKVVLGLLCHKCNVALGLFDHNIRKMQEAIEFMVNSAER